MKYIKCILSLTLICAVMAVMLAAANYITAPIIAKNEAAAANDALLVVMPSGEDFVLVDITEMGLPETVKEVYTEKNGGTVVKLTTTGFNPNMTLMVGVNADGTVSGATCLSSEETLGYEKTYGESVVGATIDTIDSVDTVSGATKTTAAYRSAVRDALNAAIVAGGGEAQKSEAELFAESLALALPAADGFTAAFIEETLDGISEIYTANNGAGDVYVVGENLVGVEKGGNIVGDFDESVKETVRLAVAKQFASSKTAIDLSSYADMPAAIEAAYKTSSGNYVFDIKASGYGINGGNKYHPASGEYIYIKVSVTADGKIISCQTVSQKESEGFGDECATPEYYTQYNGKTAETYTEVDAIGGATVTSNGYMTAISRVFEAVTILNGGANNE